MYKAHMDKDELPDAPTDVLSRLDHSLLKPNVTKSQLKELCQVADRLDVASVCLLPYFVSEAAQLLSESKVLVSTVVAFPHGATDTKAKVAEAQEALRAGAVELDVVANISRLLSSELTAIEDEIGQLTHVCHEHGAKIKVIFETCYLDRHSIVALCQICSAAGVDWVKTSTGFGQVQNRPSGATEEDVQLLRHTCPSSVQVKASGGIRTLADVRRFLRLGASRIGTSHSESIAQELQSPSQARKA